ncbi:hypothetical protein SAMN04515617_11689 [Collimonas sp. OK242]|jgi:hypothetical protein|uniref:hypothetical protein n=1 Tax=Collimonas sp. OK242 TaxID=1798195 RepID=UPI000895A609|nr:hypothetical protein [Collimonas sp. OK242]SDY56119.1 hypothetical protein SAMN04515617_11689 [Collimonas sp. OK242]
MGTTSLRDLRNLLEYQDEIDASVRRGIELINCGGSVQDAFDDLHKTLSELSNVPVAVQQNAVAKIHNAKADKDRADADAVGDAASAAEISALLNHGKRRPL